MKAIQDYYPEEFARCFGCGRLNENGYRWRTFPTGDTTETRYTPQPYHMAIPGFVNGGLLASLVDCTATGTAAWAAYRAENREMDTSPPHRFVTASLRVDYLRPTPLGPELLVRGHVKSISGRKVIIEVTVSAGGEVTVRGEVITVEVPESMWPPSAPRPPWPGRSTTAMK